MLPERGAEIPCPSVLQSAHNDTGIPEKKC
jgi:hypothetical protein